MCANIVNVEAFLKGFFEKLLRMFLTKNKSQIFTAKTGFLGETDS